MNATSKRSRITAQAPLRILIAILLVPGCTRPDLPASISRVPPANAFGVCEVMRDPKRLVGREITVSGDYALGVHERLIVGAECDKSLNLIISDTEESLRIDRQLRKIWDKRRRPTISVSYRGKLYAEHYLKLCNEDPCFHFGMDSAQIQSISIK